MAHKIIDTNVPLTAVSEDDRIPLDCKQKCTRTIGDVLHGETGVVIDNLQEAIVEYRQKMYPDPNPSAGLASQFLMYLFNYLGDPKHVHQVMLEKDENGEFVLYPQNHELATFDRSDRKWVAIAIGFKQETGMSAPIVNATDSDWLHHERVFQELGIEIDFLCKDILKAE